MRNELRREEGVSMVLIAVLLVALLGFAGIAVDLGAMWMERRELRTGADAAVLAIAEDCALGTKPCTNEIAAQTAADYTDFNAPDGSSGFEDLELDLVEQTVRLVAFAQDGDTGERGYEVALMSVFGYDRMDVTAPAAAVWGFPAAGEGIPITIEECEFYKAGPFDEETGHSDTVTLVFHDGRAPEEETVETCALRPAGQDYPGGFGWLESPLSNCLAWIVRGDWTDGGTGGGAGQPPPNTGCTVDVLREAIYQKDILIPVYSEIRGEGAGAQYYMEGFAIFHVIAYKLGNRPGYTEPAGFDCPIPGQGEDPICLRGYFKQGTLTWGEIGGQDYGAVIVKLIE
jgi:hypothetical protein